MADEPNPRMDQLLRRYASERRKHADPRLHPATRKMLQAEAARTFKERPASRGWDRVRAFWPQIVFGSGLAIVLVIAVISLRQQPSSSGELIAESPADASRPPQAAKETSLQSQDAYSAGSPAAKAAANASASSQAVPESRIVQTAKAELSDAPRQRNDFNYQADTLERRAPVSLLTEPDTRSEAVATDSARSIVRSAAVAEKLGSINQRKDPALRVQFVELRPASANQPLASFQVEQSGNKLVIQDRDGSVYSGELQQQVKRSLAGETDSGEARSLSLSFGLDVGAQTFRAEGTNRTLAKSVVITGQYLERTNNASNRGETIPYSRSIPVAAANSDIVGTSRFYRRAIIGRVTIGQTNQVLVTAVSVEP